MFEGPYPEIRHAIRPCYEKWINRVYSIDPVDQSKAEEYVELAYSQAGLHPPDEICWVDSPLAGALSAFLGVDSVRGQSDANEDEVKERVEECAKILHLVRDQPRSRVYNHIVKSVRPDLRFHITFTLHCPLQEQAWEKMGHAISDALRDDIFDALQMANNHIGIMQPYTEWSNRWEKTFYNPNEVHLLAHYDFCREIGVIKVHNLDGLVGIAQSTDWWWPLKRTCFMVKPPVFKHLDSKDRLHCVNDKAIEYSDGWGVYARYGKVIDVLEKSHRFPKALTSPAILRESDIRRRRTLIARYGRERFSRKLKVADVLNEQSIQLRRDLLKVYGRGRFSRDLEVSDVLSEENVELRRELLEVYGLPRFIKDCDAQILESNDQGEQLLCFDFDRGERLVMVELVCPSTGGRFLLRVHPRMRSIRDAVAWTFGMTGKDYKPLVET